MGEGPIFDAIEKYVAGKRDRGEWSRVTARNERYTLLSFARSFGGRKVEHLGAAHVDAWLRQGRYMPDTQALRLWVLRRFCRWLVATKRIKSDPTRGFRPVSRPRKVPVVFTYEEVARILDFCPDARGRLIVLLTVQAGLRCVEISRLELGDLIGREATIRGKAGHERLVWLADELVDALEDYLAIRGRAAGPLVLSYARPAALLPATIGKMFSAWARKAGVKTRPYDGKTAHGGRRSCATHMLDNGAPIEIVAEHLGHNDLATIRDYAKINSQRYAEHVEGRRYARLRLEVAG